MTKNALAALLSTLLFSSVASAAELTAVARVIGGTPVPQQKYPWMASLQYTTTERVGPSTTIYYYHLCGGFQISAEWLLTAAHCIKSTGLNAQDLVVTIGENDAIYDSSSDYHRVSQIIVHSGYSEETYVNDIALLRLSEPYSQSSYAKLASVATTSAMTSGDPVQVTGWGYTDNDGSTPSSLMEAEMSYLDNYLCKQAWRYSNAELTDSMICAEGAGQTDACSGDSGGPLLYAPDEQGYQAVGIVSWGASECAVAHTPSVFTRISSHLEWILGFTGSATMSSDLSFGTWPSTEQNHLTHFISNNGALQAVVNQVGISGSDFAVSEDHCSGISLDTGESCTLELSYTAGHQENATGTLSVSTNLNTLQTSLTGSSAQPMELQTFPFADSLIFYALSTSAAQFSETSQGLSLTLNSDSDTISFFIRSDVADDLTMAFAMTGSEAQTFQLKSSTKDPLNSLTGEQTGSIELSLTAGDYIAFDYSGQSGDTLILQSIDAASAPQEESNVTEEAQSSDASSEPSQDSTEETPSEEISTEEQSTETGNDQMTDETSAETSAEQEAEETQANTTEEAESSDSVTEEESSPTETESVTEETVSQQESQTTDEADNTTESSNQSSTSSASSSAKGGGSLGLVTLCLLALASLGRHKLRFCSL